MRLAASPPSPASPSFGAASVQERNVASPDAGVKAACGLDPDQYVRSATNERRLWSSVLTSSPKFEAGHYCDWYCNWPCATPCDTAETRWRKSGLCYNYW